MQNMAWKENLLFEWVIWHLYLWRRAFLTYTPWRSRRRRWQSPKRELTSPPPGWLVGWLVGLEDIGIITSVTAEKWALKMDLSSFFLFLKEKIPFKWEKRPSEKYFSKPKQTTKLSVLFELMNLIEFNNQFWWSIYYSNIEIVTRF